MKECEEGVAEILKPYLPLIRGTPLLTSLLYDIDMLPEQTVTRQGAIRLAGLCEAWKHDPKEDAETRRAEGAG